MTKKRLIILSSGALIVLLLAALAGAMLVFAEEPPLTPDFPFGGRGGGRGLGGFGWHGGGRGWGGFAWAGGEQWTMFDAAAEALGLTPEELFAELRAGKSLTEIAEEQGIEVEAVYDALHAARVEAMQRAGGGMWTMFDTVAEALGLTPEEFFAELRAGKSPAEIAEEQGVEMDAVYDAITSAQGEAMQQAIEQAVEDGRLSQEQADWLLEGLDSGYWAGRGFGFGRGMRGGFGFGRGMKGRFGSFAPPSAPSTAPSSSSL